MHAVRWMMLGSAALALAACGSKTETSSTDTKVVSADTNVAMTDLPAASPGQAFADAAAASDAFEIATSRLADAQGASAKSRKFAAEMVKAHSQSTEKLKSAAAAAVPALVPDPTLTEEQQRTVESLKVLKGAGFDKAYAVAQVEAHQKTLDALKSNAADVNVPQPLRDFAAQLIPTVTAHLNLARTL